MLTHVQLPFFVIFGIDLFISSEQACINCISIVRAFYILRLLHFIALLTSTFEFFVRRGKNWWDVNEW